MPRTELSSADSTRSAGDAFMDIVKKSNLNTLQLKTTETLTLWGKIFPQSKAGNTLKGLWDQEVSLPHSQSGFRTWRCFSGGSLADPENILETHSKEWLVICEGQNELAIAFVADRMAVAFSGELSNAVLEDVCGEMPDCEKCELSSECL